MKSKINATADRANKFRLIDKDGRAIIDPNAPWKLTLRDCKSFVYTQKTSASKWRDLIDRAMWGDAEAEWEVADRYADGRILKQPFNVFVRR
jgi:hypothetical protein